MKRYFKYLAMTALMFSFTACSDEFLEFVPLDRSTVGAWYQDETQIRASTAAMYGRPWFSYNDVFSWVAGDLLAGDILHTWDQEGQFFYTSFNENNTHIGAGWQSLYDVISFANLIISDMPGVAAGNGVDQATIDAGLAEARFFRGTAYFLLVEYWEEVPIIENPAEIVAAGTYNELPRATTSSAYDFIKNDLSFAAANLPASDEPGRVTTWAARGMLAKVHLAVAQRRVGDSSFPSSTSDDFAEAARLAGEVYNSGLSLYPNYEDLFKIENEHAEEVLFGLQWITAGWGVGNSRQARFARHSAVTGDGQAWGGGKCMTLDFLSDMEANTGTANIDSDERRRGIFMVQGDFYDYIGDGSGYNMTIVQRDGDGNQESGASPTLGALKKYVVGGVNDHGFPIANQDSPLDSYMLRLADVYLLYAEALMGAGNDLSGGPGLAALNDVRARAGLGARASVTFDQLMTERRVETALEGQSWLDVRRQYYRDPSGTIADLNAQRRTGRMYPIDDDQTLENDPANYEILYSGETGTGDNENTDVVVTFTADNMVLPIPGSEVVQNELLNKELHPAVDYVIAE